MRARVMIAATVLALLTATGAHAAKVLHRMTPQALDTMGFSVTTQKAENGTVEFRVSRDVKKARWEGRSAYLDVQGDAGKIAECQLAPARERKKDTVTYRFNIAPDQVRHSVFTLWEVQTAPGELDIIGGGDIYEFRLADFVGKPAAK